MRIVAYVHRTPPQCYLWSWRGDDLYFSLGTGKYRWWPGVSYGVKDLPTVLHWSFILGGGYTGRSEWRRVYPNPCVYPFYDIRRLIVSLT